MIRTIYLFLGVPHPCTQEIIKKKTKWNKIKKEIMEHREIEQEKLKFIKINLTVLPLSGEEEE